MPSGVRLLDHAVMTITARAMTFEPTLIHPARTLGEIEGDQIIALHRDDDLPHGRLDTIDLQHGFIHPAKLRIAAGESQFDSVGIDGTMA